MTTETHPQQSAPISESLDTWFAIYRYEITLVIVFVAAALMFAFSGVFQTNTFDWEQIHRGPALIIQGQNPYPPPSDTFNPPHLLLVGVPWIYGSVQIYVMMMVLAVGMVTFIKRRAWLAVYLILPPFIIHNLAAGNIGVTISAVGMVLLWFAQQRAKDGKPYDWLNIFLVGWAYGLLTTKPQLGGVVVALHFLWLLQYGDRKTALRVGMMAVMLILVLPSLIALLTGAIFEGELRLIWLEWIDAITSGVQSEVNFENGSADQVIVNRFGIGGGLAVTALLYALFANRHGSYDPRIIFQRFTLIDIFQAGFTLPLIWFTYVLPEVVALVWLLTMRPRQILVYFVLIWWLSVWIYPLETQRGIVFIPQQGYFLIPMLLVFADDAMRHLPSAESYQAAVQSHPQGT